MITKVVAVRDPNFAFPANYVELCYVMHKKKVNQLQNGSILSHILSKVTEILEQQCNTLESQTTVNLENHINPGAWFSFQSYHSIKHLA